MEKRGVRVGEKEREGKSKGRGEEKTLGIGKFWNSTLSWDLKEFDNMPMTPSIYDVNNALQRKSAGNSQILLHRDRRDYETMKNV